MNRFITFNLTSTFKKKKINSKYEICSHRRKCFIVNFFGKVFILTTAHNIKNDSKDILKLPGKDIILNNKFIIPEIDLAVYRVDGIFSPEKCKINLNTNNLDISIYNDESIFHLNKSDGIIDMKKFRLIKSKYGGNLCYPTMLMFRGEIQKKNRINLEGYSGSPIYEGKNFLGILSGNNEKNVMVIPNFLILRVIKEINMYNMFSGFCSFYHDLNLDKGNLTIEKDTDIDYNIYFKGSKVYNILLKKKDILCKIDNHQIINGMIFDKNLNIPIDLDTYIKIYKTVNDYNEFEIVRNSNKQKEIIITTGNRDINSCLSIDLNKLYSKYYPINGDIYAEITPELYADIISARELDDKLVYILQPEYLQSRKYILVQSSNKKYSIFSKKTHNFYLFNYSGKITNISSSFKKIYRL